MTAPWKRSVTPWQTPAFAKPSLGDADVGGVAFVRAIRLIRVFRVFKVGKYSLGIQMFAGAIKHSAQPMGILVLVTSVGAPAQRFVRR